MEKNALQIFSSADVEEITALIAKMEQSSFDYLELEGDGVRIVISKNAAMPESARANAATAAPVATTIQGSAIGATPEAVSTQVVASEALATAAPIHETADTEARQAETMGKQPDIVSIKAPSYGLFYAQPEPGAPPYVSVGCQVKVGDTIGLLEIMKTFSAITSTVDGEVVAIFVKNEQLLEPDMPLISVRVQA